MTDRPLVFRAAVLCALLTGTALSGCGQGGPPLGSSPPSGKPMLPIETITPQYSELPVDRSIDPADTVPWQLIEVDRQENGVYLSASTTECRTPDKVRVSESASEIRITVTASSGKEPCTMQYVTLIGYVQLDAIGDRPVIGEG